MLAETKTYEEGLVEAWELARKIMLSPRDGGYTNDELAAMFGNNKSSSVVLKDVDVFDVKEKVRTFEARKDIKLNDEVIIRGKKGIVTFIHDDSTVELLMENGLPQKESLNNLSKTGRSFNVQDLLSGMAR